MKTLFLDAGYLIAIEAADDQNHQAAFSHWQQINKIPNNE
jgi:predicted nucleic acid-binding protein